MLWATALKVKHPNNGETVRFSSRPPAAKFDSFLAREQQRWDKLHHKPRERESERGFSGQGRGPDAEADS